MKHVKHLFTALLLLCSTVAVAHNFEVDGIYYNITSSTDNTVAVTYRGSSYSSYSDEYSGAVTIPASVTYNETTYSVTSIGNYAFYNCSGLTSIEIPNSVTSIGNYAFYNCSGLTSIEILNSVTSIGEYAFSGCSGLTCVEIPNSVTTIGEWAFCRCSGLTSVEIPNSVTSIGESAFNNCSGLASVTIGNSVISIGDAAFYFCTGLTSVEFNAVNCTTMGSSDNYVFMECKALSTITIGENVKKIPNYAFAECRSLTSIEIPNSVTRIGVYAFENCTSLTSIEISNSVTSIGIGAFQNCTSLTSIEIPNSVTSIGVYAFSDCRNLTSITSLIPADALFAVSSNAFYNVGKNACILYVPFGAKETYAATAGWSLFTNIVEIEQTETIGGSCGENVHWTLENGVLTISGSGAMNDMPNGAPWTEYLLEIKNIVIKDGVTEIGEYAFCNLTELTSVTIPNSIENIGNNAFDNSWNLNEVYISDISAWCNINFNYRYSNPLYMAGNLYLNGELLTNLVIPDDIVEIKDYAFVGGHCFTELSIHDGVTSIGQCAFENCNNIIQVTIGEGVTNIGQWAFGACNKIKNITSMIPSDRLFSINSNVFQYLDLTKKVVIYVPYGAKETYAATAGWSEFVNIVELERPTIKVTINQYGNATFCSEYALDFSEVEGLKAYAATGYKANSQVVTLTRVQTAEAGIGLFLKGEPGEYVVPVIESTDEHSLNMLVGTLEQTTVNSTDGAMSNYKFTITEGDDAPMFYPFEDNTTFSAGKAYLQIPTAWLPATAQRSLSIRFDNGTTTDIEDIENESVCEQNVYYDLQGSKVENPTNGIYIINGKKVFIK